MNNTRTLAHSDTDTFTEKLGELRELLADLAKTAPAAASDSIQSFRKQATAKAGEAAQLAVKTVKENPVQVALIAAGAGLLAWYLISRNHDSAAKE
jgi:ElaB/YqjD/DUF883 family membrane-anchored ribosome-binding protein